MATFPYGMRHEAELLDAESATSVQGAYDRSENAVFCITGASRRHKNKLFDQSSIFDTLFKFLGSGFHFFDPAFCECSEFSDIPQELSPGPSEISENIISCSILRG
jgi:hypothetical protein